MLMLNPAVVGIGISVGNGKLESAVTPAGNALHVIGMVSGGAGNESQSHVAPAIENAAPLPGQLVRLAVV